MINLPLDDLVTALEIFKLYGGTDLEIIAAGMYVNAAPPDHMTEIERIRLVRFGWKYIIQMNSWAKFLV